MLWSKPGFLSRSMMVRDHDHAFLITRVRPSNYDTASLTPREPCSVRSAVGGSSSTHGAFPKHEGKEEEENVTRCLHITIMMEQIRE